MPREALKPRRCALAGLGLLLAACAAAPPTAPEAGGPPLRQPAPPYFSIQLSTHASAEPALAVLDGARDYPYARAEERNNGYIVRIGAWARREEAETILPQVRERFGRSARVVQMQNPSDWLLPGGGRAVAWGSTPRATEPVLLPATLPPRPQGVVETGERYREFARRLDTETRRLLKTSGAARRDGFLYGMDVAPLLLYAAERGDAALYQQLLPAARKLIVAGPDDSFARGFVLWRQKDGAKPEVSGTAEAAWMARALWAGAQAFGRDEDRALALQVLDGYARHAYELQQVWLVRKYFAFGGRTFATYSMLPSYQPDFLAETEATHGRAAWQGFAERSYALLERAVSPSRLLYPVIQPEIGATYPALGLDVYGPNNVVALADSCEAADAALRGLPDLARGVLGFAKDARPNRYGRLVAYFDGGSGEPVGEVPLSSAAYACLGRLAAALGDQDAWKQLEPKLQADMDPAPTVALSQDAPLYAAGPQLRTALAAGAFKP